MGLLTLRWADQPNLGDPLRSTLRSLTAALAAIVLLSGCANAGDVAVVAEVKTGRTRRPHRPPVVPHAAMGPGHEDREDRASLRHMWFNLGSAAARIALCT